jgi:hypothetical protein
LPLRSRRLCILSIEQLLIVGKAISSNAYVGYRTGIMGRTIAVCQIQACKMGTPFAPLHIRRRNILAKCAAAERALMP